MKKIMFNDKYGLTQAVLEGRKTQTRRVINVNPSVDIDGCKHLPDGSAVCGQLSNGKWIFSNRLRSTYKIGEEVAVAQAYKDIPSISDINYVDIDWVRASKNLPFGKWGCANKMKGWANKMFVRADLMPHRIKITNVRVERLQDISDDDCLKEGIDEDKRYSFGNPNDRYSFDTPRDAFAALIDKTCGRGTWDSNPWVFVYDFKLIR